MNTKGTWSSVTDRAMCWLMSSDTGVSSETIVSAALGIRLDSHFSDDAPYDPADFGRCHRLLQKIPELRSIAFLKLQHRPEWAGLVKEWDRLTEIYLRELPSGRCPELYAEIKRLRGGSCTAA